MRLFDESDTHRYPSGPMVIRHGVLNWPLPVPAVPNWRRYSPVDVNSWILLLDVSATQTLPLESIATSPGFVNCPLPDPADPTVRTNAPSPVNSSILLLQ